MFKHKGYEPEVLESPEAVGLIKATYSVYKEAVDTGIGDNDIPEAMARKLDHDAFIFSGFKVHHELSEVGLSLRDKDGKVKNYDTFKEDVRKVHGKYNENYLKSEYQFAVTSSQMAARWQDVAGDGDRYDLQYRTAGDSRVRDEHAAMEGITLPADDPFWKQYYPPNGWRCRCTTVQVNKGKYPVSDSKEAIRIGERSTTQLDRFGNNKAAIFRFNPGMEEKVFPPRHPYGKVDKETKQVIEKVANIEQRRQQYEKLKSDPDYNDVVFDEKTGGLKATHRFHSFDKQGGVYERHVQNAGFKNGHAVILGEERGDVFGLKYTEGTWDGLQFEVAGRETATINNIKRGLEHCADKRSTQIAVLDFPNGGFSIDNFETALRRYKGLEKLHDGQFLKFKKIICTQDEQIVYEVEL